MSDPWWSFRLWFAFKLVSLNHWKQLSRSLFYCRSVVICFQISIFEPLETTFTYNLILKLLLWFAFKLVSLNHWKQPWIIRYDNAGVVICFQISIFEPLETTIGDYLFNTVELWFAFKLVSLNHWKQPNQKKYFELAVVICFQISIFEPLETTNHDPIDISKELWFAFKLVSLNHWKQQLSMFTSLAYCCDLLSN